MSASAARPLGGHSQTGSLGGVSAGQGSGEGVTSLGQFCCKSQGGVGVTSLHEHAGAWSAGMRALAAVADEARAEVLYAAAEHAGSAHAHAGAGSAAPAGQADASASDARGR